MCIRDSLFGGAGLDERRDNHLDQSADVYKRQVLSKTRVGLRLRAVGENPGAADAVGINVTKYKYFAILIGSVIAGLGGLYYVMDKSGGTTFVEASIDSFGWLAVALVIDVYKRQPIPCTS